MEPSLKGHHRGDVTFQLGVAPGLKTAVVIAQRPGDCLPKTVCVALVVHKAQGLTCDTALLLGDDNLYAELGYTGLTRGRQKNHLYTIVSTQDFDADGDELAHLVRALGTSLSDMATIEYVSALVGKEHVRSDLDEQSWSRADERPPARTPATAVPFVSASVLRQMTVGDALLLHGELPPAWIRSSAR